MRAFKVKERKAPEPELQPLKPMETGGIWGSVKSVAGGVGGCWRETFLYKNGGNIQSHLPGANSTASEWLRPATYKAKEKVC